MLSQAINSHDMNHVAKKRLYGFFTHSVCVGGGGGGWREVGIVLLASVGVSCPLSNLNALWNFDDTW